MPADDLQRFLDGRHHAARDRVREWLSSEANAPVHDLPIEEHRAQVLAWARELAGPGGAVVVTGSIYLVADLLGEPGRRRKSAL